MSAEIAPRLLPWFDQYGRKDLPWQCKDGYRVWLSEIMLQQTQVSTVIPYYQRFLESFPDLQALADAELDSVLQHWAGLGYYARARNLHAAAKQVRDLHQGRMPDQAEQLEQLPGVGRSTAAAIASLAFGHRAAILDGNVKRVLARVFQVKGWYGQSATLKKLWQLAETQTPEDRVADYNQAMMDLGATLCRRGRPDCERCPLQDICLSYQQNTQLDYPEPRPRKSRPQRHQWLLLHQREQHLLLERRPPSGIWGGLWSLPAIDELDSLELWQRENLGFVTDPADLIESQANVMLHKFTHFDLQLSLVRISIPTRKLDATAEHIAEPSGAQWIHQRQLDQYGLPAPIKKILSRSLDQTRA